jgi:outer membrane lipoprotein-sorting protein
MRFGGVNKKSEELMKFPLVLFTLIIAQPIWAAPSALEILKKSDAIRMPAGDRTVIVTVLSKRRDGQEDKATYEVLTKGADKTLIKTLSPATDRGTSMLMLGHDMWIFMPSVEKPIRVALQQRLMGQVANGDLARANFVGDYTPAIAKAGKGFYELKLTAVSDEVTYDRVQLWVDAATYRPLRAAFYASSGRLLKVGHYKDYKKMSGAMRPSRLVFEDAVDKSKQSTIVYDDIQTATHPDKYFTKDYLKKLKY